VPGLLTQVEQYINNHAADPDALYVVWSGPNDFMWGFEDPETTITTAVTNISNAAERLFAHGARHIVVPNMMPIGRSPKVVAAGMAELMTEVSRNFNYALILRLSQLDFATTYMDVVSLSQGIFGNPEVYGFSNVTEPCLVLEPFSQCLNPDTYLFWDEGVISLR
jgi:phospholipase/lecithinase/hemolysin